MSFDLDMFAFGWLLGLAVLLLIAVRVYLDPVHRSPVSRVAWALFSGCLPLFGYFVFLVYRYVRVMRHTPAMVR